MFPQDENDYCFPSELYTIYKMAVETSTLVQHKPLKEEIFEVLHRQIIAGKYSPGEWLRQEDIASQMGVSMTPVREALDLLAASGLAERVPYRGVRVLQLSTQEIIESYGLRIMLEPVAAKEAAPRITPRQVEALNEIVEQMRSHVTLNDMSRARQLSREFHMFIVAASGNTLLNKLYNLVANTFPDWMLYEAMFRHPELLENSLAREQAEHAAIVSALACGDPEKAAQKTLEHILHIGKDLEELLDIPAELIRRKEYLVKP